MPPETAGVSPRQLSEQDREDQYPADWEERRRQVLQRDDFTCQLCGRRGGPHAEEDAAIYLHAHHTVPPSRGGSNAVENLITLCNACYDHHRGRRASAGDDTWLSLGALVATWTALVGMTAGALEFGTTLLGEPLFGVNPVAALVAAVVLFAVVLRLLNTRRWGPTFGTTGAVLTWLIPLQASGELQAIPADAGTLSVVAGATVLTVLPWVLVHVVEFDRTHDEEGTSFEAQGA